MNIEYKADDLGLLLRIPKRILKEIQILSNQFYPKEIGGVILGSYEENSKKATIEQLIIPKKIVHGPYFFERKISWINKELQRLYKESNGKSIYIGEWHSHPNCAATPSQTDLESIQDVYNDKGVKVNSPILLIAHISKESFHVNAFIFHKKKFYNYVQVNFLE